MTIEAIAILISGAGIVATCGIETWLVMRQIRASEFINKEQLRVQSEALVSQFEFQKDEARRARILSNHRESMEIMRELHEKVYDSVGTGKDCDLYDLIERTPLVFIITDLCRDLEDVQHIRTSFSKILEDPMEGQRADANKLISDLMEDVLKGTEGALKQLEKSL